MSDCPHVFAVRWRVLAHGRMVWGKQCASCGSWSQVKAETLNPSVMQAAKEYDESISPAYWKLRQQAYQDDAAMRAAEATAAAVAEHRAWWARYNEYTRSPEWRAKRELVLKRDNYTCQACLQRQATQVHHKTYAHVFHEPLFELESICEPCHEAITQSDRGNRTWKSTG